MRGYWWNFVQRSSVRRGANQVRTPCADRIDSFCEVRGGRLWHEAGVAGAVAQALIGHDSEAIHEHYVNVGREALQKAAAIFPSI